MRRYRPPAGLLGNEASKEKHMRTIVKSRHMTLSEPLKTYVEAKIMHAARKWSDEPSVTLEVELSDLFGPKRGNDKQCEVVMTLPHGNIVRIEEVSDDLYAAIDAAGDRLGQALERYKGKKLIGGRYPTKYFLAKKLNGTDFPEAEA
jgi:putative sigma-54 modulation protein